MKFYTLLNNNKFLSVYKSQLKELQSLNNKNEFNLSNYKKDLYSMQKSMRHNLIVMQDTKIPNIYYLMTKTTTFKPFVRPLNGFESDSKRTLIDIEQEDSGLGYAKCIFMFELQETDDIHKLLLPLDDAVVKKSFGSVSNAEKLYKSAQDFYINNKNNPNSWVDITRYVTVPDEMYKQHCYLNFMDNQNYPFKEGGIYDYNELNKVDSEALKLYQDTKNLLEQKKPSEEL